MSAEWSEPLSEVLKKANARFGIVRGTKVKALHKSPCGDPVAYMIRGAVLAVRGSDAEKIFIGYR